MFVGVICGKLKGNPVIQEDGDSIKGSFTLSVRRFEASVKKTFWDNITIIAGGGAARKLKDLMPDDELFVVTDMKFLEGGGIQLRTYNIKRLGEEGVNLHFIAGAVESADLTYAQSGDEKCRMKVRVPVQSFKNPGETFDQWFTLVAWKNKAETAFQYLQPSDTEAQWAAFQCATSMRSFENQQGEKIWFQESNMNQMNFTNTSTTPKPRNTGNKGEEGESVGSADLSDLPDMEDLPF